MKTEIVTRKYHDWLGTLADVGGFTELVFIFFTWIYVFYHKCSVRNHLKRVLFDRTTTTATTDKLLEEEELERQYLIEEDLEQTNNLEDSLREIQGLRVLNQINFEDYHVVLLPELLLSIRKQHKMRHKT